ncbi:MAG: hypothetical protein KatS3mg110_2794 [Pirellulaceae bacterium]|nr:MAG: hypothetical protein KatS3mg110_2794 [Pirellulaceae bacterium]
MQTVGGMRQIAASPARPMAAYAEPATQRLYHWSSCGNHWISPHAHRPIAASKKAYTRSGCQREGTSQGTPILPRHIPPMNVPNRTASERDDAPITSSSN